jgi:hypothetical protein
VSLDVEVCIAYQLHCVPVYSTHIAKEDVLAYLTNAGSMLSAAYPLAWRLRRCRTGRHTVGVAHSRETRPHIGGWRSTIERVSV